jgi:hypothetical protein
MKATSAILNSSVRRLVFASVAAATLCALAF